MCSLRICFSSLYIEFVLSSLWFCQAAQKVSLLGKKKEPGEMERNSRWSSLKPYTHEQHKMDLEDYTYVFIHMYAIIITKDKTKGHHP